MIEKKQEEEVIDLDKLPVQLSLGLDLAKEPEKIVRPEHNVGRMSPYIFSNPRSPLLEEVEVHRFPIKYDGQDIEGKLTIVPAKGYTRPTTTTQRVFLGLIQIWETLYSDRVNEYDPEKDNIFDFMIVKFSGRQLCKHIGWASCGDSYASIRDHLDILRRTTIDWDTLFVDPDTKRQRQEVKDLSLLQKNSYIKERSLIDEGKDKFDQVHEIQLSDIVVRGMLKKHVRPFNFQTFKTIRNPSASALYTHLDFKLSKQTIYSHNSKGLLFDVLGLRGEYLKHASRRRVQLEKLTAELEGKEIGVSSTNPTYLSLSVEKTVDGTDWKLVARKISEKEAIRPKALSSNHKFARPLRKKVEANRLATEIYHRLTVLPKCGKLTIDDLVGICVYTPEDILRTCLTDVISEYSRGGNVRKSLSAIYFHAVQSEMKKRNLPYPKKA